MHIFGNSKPTIGVDISDNSIKMIQLKKFKDRAAVQALAFCDLPENSVINGEIKNKEEIAAALKKMLDKPKHGKFTTRDIIACLPESKTFLKLIRIEKSPNKISEIIGAEIEKNIPLSASDIYYDWQIIKEDNSADHVLVGACPKNTLDQYLDIFEAAKLTAIALEIEAISTARALLLEEMPRFKNLPSRNIAVIDLGASDSSMFVYADNTIVFTLHIPLSGNAVTEEISKTLEIDKEQAEKAKIICGLDQNKARGIINNLLSEMISKLIEKIKEGLEYYNNYYDPQTAITQLILCGGGAYIKGLDRIIEARLGIETILGDAVINLDRKIIENNKYFTENHSYQGFDSGKNTGGKISLTQESSLSYATAIGLSLRSLFIK